LIDSAITVATEAEKLGLLGFLCLVVAVLSMGGEGGVQGQGGL